MKTKCAKEDFKCGNYFLSDEKTSAKQKILLNDKENIISS